MSETPAGTLVVLTAEGTFALGPDVADAPKPELSRAVYDQLCTLGLRQEMLTVLVFVIEADAQEVEMCRQDVQPEDLLGLARAYWHLPTWAQRVCLVNLVCDHRDTVLDSLWPDILRAPVRGDDDARHYAKVIALWRMAGSNGDMIDFDNSNLVRQATERLGATVTMPPELVRPSTR
jgi:hypothetical protein